MGPHFPYPKRTGARADKPETRRYRNTAECEQLGFQRQPPPRPWANNLAGPAPGILYLQSWDYNASTELSREDQVYKNVPHVGLVFQKYQRPTCLLSLLPSKVRCCKSTEIERSVTQTKLLTKLSMFFYWAVGTHILCLCLKHKC